jgi:elongation factor P
LQVQAIQLRAGMLVKYKNDVCSVHQTEHRTPGKGRGFVQAKFRNHRTGAISEHKLASSESFERVSLEPRNMEYLYSEGGNYHFMNTETYEQEELATDLLGDQVNYLMPNMVIEVQFYEGTPFSLNLPASVDMIVTETTPAIKGATVTNVTKPATTETGLVVQVPPFIKGGEKIRISTVDGAYQGRSN